MLLSHHIHELKLFSLQCYSSFCIEQEINLRNLLFSHTIFFIVDQSHHLLTQGHHKLKKIILTLAFLLVIQNHLV